MIFRHHIQVFHVFFGGSHGVAGYGYCNWETYNLHGWSLDEHTRFAHPLTLHLMDAVLADFVLHEIVHEFCRSQLPGTGFRN